MTTSDPPGHAGDITAAEAYSRLASDPGAVLIDVRTEPEWRYVGTPDLSELEKSVMYLSWQVYPSMSKLPHFVDTLTKELGWRGAEPADALLFICRSGVRSRDAAIAMAASGWSRCYNVSDGFEGPMDRMRRRVVSGWKVAGLPWVQT
ncbi:MAG: rhodanese-like domain-containing protein [Roseiarcus sp.]